MDTCLNERYHQTPKATKTKQRDAANQHRPEETNQPYTINVIGTQLMDVNYVLVAHWLSQLLTFPKGTSQFTLRTEQHAVSQRLSG